MSNKKEIDPYWQTFLVLVCLILLAIYFGAGEESPTCKATPFETQAKPQ